MRILRLDLLAFGPFTGGRLDFAKKPDALQLVYGPNEAGKSTTLRALLALLYGIPVRTGDAHVHDMTRLRVGALIEDHRGRLLNLTRRKGAKHTLLDDKGEPMADGALSDLLLGIDETMFRQMFGLDHQRLREGGEALLAGSGNLGEGLFDASVGTRALRQVKEALKAEAEALYKARGKTPRLNLALDALREKRARQREAALSPQAFVEQTRALDVARARRAACVAERRELLTERARIERELRLVPVLARHAQLLAELKQVAGADGHASEAASMEGLPEERLRDLERRYGVVLAFEAEQPRAQADAAVLEREIDALRARLGPAAAVQQSIDTPLRTRWRKLADAHGAAARRVAELGDERSLREAELARLAQRLTELALVPAPSGLSELVEQIEREDVSAQRGRAELELSRRAEAVGRGVAQLRVAWAGGHEPLALCQRLAALRLPDERELAALELREQELLRETERTRERERELALRAGELGRGRAELLAQGELSTPADLSRARGERDAVLESLTREPARLRECQLAVERADALSDRLLREALRSAELARLTRELDQIEREQSALSRATDARQQRGAALSEQLSALGAELGLRAAGVAALRPKLAKLSALRDAAGEVSAQQLAVEALRAREGELSGRLERTLEQGENGPHAGLESVLIAARARLRAAAASVEQRAQVERAYAEESVRVAATRRQLAELQREQAAALERLNAELKERGFPPELGHDEVLACLDDLSLLSDAERRRAAQQERTHSAEAQRAQLTRDVQELVLRLLPQLQAQPLSEQLAQLGQLARSARESERDGARLRQELAAAERELIELGDGAELTALRARARELAPHVLRARLLELESQQSSLDEELAGLDQRIGGLEVGLSRVTEAPHAVPLAEEVEAELASVRALTRRYLEVRLSLSLLTREVERHRAQHQGPLVSRASALFSSLTLGRYRGLSVELDEADEPLLCAATTSGKLVRVAGLSDGTRDQLYLALRIASIERFLAQSPALPLVLDDAFIHFDDARAEVAISALAELSKKTQVLFFTHHARMVEIAKRALKSSQVALHELDPVRGTVAFRDNGPLFADA